MIEPAPPPPLPNMVCTLVKMSTMDGPYRWAS